MARILLIDDFQDFSEILQEQLQPLGHDWYWLNSAEKGLEYLAENAVDLVLLDNKMPRMTGLEFLTARSERAIRLGVPVILMTGANNDRTAIDAFRGGAVKYVIKPRMNSDIARIFGPLIAKVLQDYSPRVVPPIEDDGPDDADGPMICESPGMLTVLETIGRLVDLDEPVLILGERGTGKELVASRIHQHSRRSAAGKYLAINCAGFQEQLLESQLFGHEKGAFTGADCRRIGHFEYCDGGTLFLDEIGDMTPLTQSKVLRVLNKQSFERVGGHETIRTDVRIVAATNVDLEAAAAAGRFREDLYDRLNVFPIMLPPLRERGDDLPLLVEHFVRCFRRKLRCDVQSVSPEALEALCRYHWPGNIRELQNVLQQALLHATGSVLLRSFLPPLVAGDPNPETMNKGAPLVGLTHLIAWLWNQEQKDLWPTLEALAQKELLRHALVQQPRESEKNIAERLGIVKNTLRAWRQKYRLDGAAKGE